MVVKFLYTALAALGLIAPATAQSFDQVVQAEVLTGWRNADGSHTAALRITLNPGWKTYWRAPGDSGIPPTITWDGSRNLSQVDITWPTPEVFSQNGLRSIGYDEELILPVRIMPRRDGQDMRLNAELEIGVCRDICVPQTLKVKAELPTSGTRDARIAAALADRPLTASEAQVGKVTCSVRPTAHGIGISARITMPSAGGKEIAVIETGDPKIWVAEGETHRNGNVIETHTEMMHVEGAPFILDRSALRITVLGSNHAVDIEGCSS